MGEILVSVDVNGIGVDWIDFWKWLNDFCGWFGKESKVVWYFLNIWEIINILEKF